MANPRKRRLQKQLIEEKLKQARELGFSLVSKDLLLSLPEKVTEELKEEKKEEKPVEKQKVEPKEEEVPAVALPKPRGRPKANNEK